MAVAPIDLSKGMMKEIRAKWLVDMASYISDNPQFIMNGFIHAGITEALNGEDIIDASSSDPEDVAITTSEESEDDDEDSTPIDFIVL